LGIRASGACGTSSCCPRIAALAAVRGQGRPHFDRLLLHTEHAGRFYERHGFVRFDDERTHSTHALALR
jgi:hypothetical protein